MKISINLLPEDVKIQEIETLRKNNLNLIGVFIIIVFIIITSILLVLRALQSTQLGKIDNDLNNSNSTIITLQEKQNLLTSLKSRIASITTISKQESKQTTGFNLITEIKPKPVSLQFLALDKVGAIALSADSTQIDSIAELFDKLTDPNSNENRVAKVDLDSLNRGGLEKYRFDLKITQK